MVSANTFILLSVTVFLKATLQKKKIISTSHLLSHSVLKSCFQCCSSFFSRISSNQVPFFLILVGWFALLYSSHSRVIHMFWEKQEKHLDSLEHHVAKMSQLFWLDVKGRTTRIDLSLPEGGCADGHTWDVHYARWTWSPPPPEHCRWEALTFLLMTKLHFFAIVSTGLSPPLQRECVRCGWPLIDAKPIFKKKKKETVRVVVQYSLQCGAHRMPSQCSGRTREQAHMGDLTPSIQGRAPLFLI